MNLSHTEYSGLTLIQFSNTSGSKKHYQHVTSDGAQVGELYPTKDQALHDTVDYAYRAGWMPKHMERAYNEYSDYIFHLEKADGSKYDVYEFHVKDLSWAVDSVVRKNSDLVSMRFKKVKKTN